MEWYDVSHVKLLQLLLLFFLFIVISRVNVIVHVNVHANVHVIVIAHAIAPVHDDVIKWKHFPRNWPFVRGIHRSPVYSPHKGQWRRALMFSLICVWINDWVNNREAGDISLSMSLSHSMSLSITMFIIHRHCRSTMVFVIIIIICIVKPLI